jgi:hypothetical protein
MKQALWSLSKVVLSNRLKEVEGGFFTCLHQTRELRTIQNGEQIPIYSVRPAAVDAVVLPHHNHQFIFELNHGCLPQILGIYREVGCETLSNHQCPCLTKSPGISTGNV